MKRVMREYGKIMSGPVEGWRVFVGADDVCSWKALLGGRPAPYEGGTWLLTLDFPPSYPVQPPRMRFVTPVYHCNISADGVICMEQLRDAWSPALDAHALLGMVRNLLLPPDANNPLDNMKAALYRDYVNDGDGAYMAEAQRHTASHASDPVETLAAKYNIPTEDRA